MFRRKPFWFLFLAGWFCFCNGCHKGVSEKEAQQLLRSIAEVQAFSEKLRQKDGDVRLIIQTEPGADPDLYSFYIGESDALHTVIWNRFAVYKKSGAVLVLDIESGEYLPIEIWRQTEK